jgi:hypothetical protein
MVHGIFLEVYSFFHSPLGSDNGNFYLKSFDENKQLKNTINFENGHSDNV